MVVVIRDGRNLSVVLLVNFPDFLDHDDLPSNGLAVTPDHINEEDDRSSHASSSDWTPQPQIGKACAPISHYISTSGRYNQYKSC